MRQTTEDAQGWLDRFLAEYYRQSPVNATFIGVHEYDHLLPDASEQGLSDMLNSARSMLTQIAWTDITDIDPITSIDLDLARGHLEIQQWELLSRHFQRGNPAWYTGEAVFGVLSLFLRDFAPLETRVSAATERLRAIPEFLAQGRENIPSSHPDWISRAVRECDGAIALFRRGLPMLNNDPMLVSAAGDAARAFAEHRDFLTSPETSDPSFDVAAGEEAFDRLLRKGHFLDMDAEDVLQHAEHQAAESEQALDAGARDFGHADWREVIAELQNFHPSVERYYAEYQQVWDAARSHAIEHELVTWPDYPIRYVPRPEWTREAAPYLYFLFYRSPAAFDDIEVVDYLVTPIEPWMEAAEQDALLRSHNDSVIKLNHVVHHGGIGHHVQNWHAFRAPSRIGRIAAVDCTSRIAMFCGGTMAEGWSSYATELMGEAGFLTPLERLSQHHARLRAALRAIADVRIHRGEWTIDAAADAFQQRVGMSGAAAHDEAVKNSMFPGAAMIYLIGTDMIRNLREDARAAAGDGFSLREFHDEFLSYGSIPVSIIAEEMRATYSDAE